MIRITAGAALMIVVLCGALSSLAADPPPRPRLAVVVVVDQLAYDFLERFDANFTADGLFRRIQRGGALCSNCRFEQAVTVTAVGHSVISTGAHPHLTGIVENGWFDRSERRVVGSVEDREAPIVGAERPAGAPGASPRRLLVPTLGDSLKLATQGRGRVFSIAVKDRAAILMGGFAADGAFWYDLPSSHWVTSAYYAPQLPDYLREINESQAVEKLAGATWSALYPPERYLTGEIEPAYGATTRPARRPHGLPFRVPPADETGRYRMQVLMTPFANDLTLDAARGIIEHERLGQDEWPDLLWISLSANDVAGHAFGPLSREVEDLTYRTDEALGRLARWLDERLPGAWVLALSADHGVGPVPEDAARLRIPAARQRLGKSKEIKAALEQRLRSQLGEPADGKSYVVEVADYDVYLDLQLPELAGERADLARRTVRDELLARDGVALSLTRGQILDRSPATALEAAVRLGFNPLRSGDVYYLMAPYDLVTGGNPASHGTPWRYDAHVPLCFLGAGVNAARIDERTSPAQLAPTLARLLRIEPPPACEAEPVSAALQR